MQLLAHPASPPGPVRQLEADAALDREGQLHLSWRLDAPLSQLRLPPAMTPAPADELWRHTCFEAFVRTPGAPGYCELNFAPSGGWAAYRFAGYRAGMRPLGLPAPPAAHWHRTDARLALDVTVRVAELVPLEENSSLRLGLAAVIEDGAGNIGYWALRHAPGKPDFHHLDGFVLTLETGAIERGSHAS